MLVNIACPMFRLFSPQSLFDICMLRFLEPITFLNLLLSSAAVMLPQPSSMRSATQSSQRPIIHRPMSGAGQAVLPPGSQLFGAGDEEEEEEVYTL